MSGWKCICECLNASWSTKCGRCNEPKTVIMPKALTAENGAKGLLIGDFHEEITLPCPECWDLNDDDADDDCEICKGDGKYIQKVVISWTNMKDIYKMAVKNLGKEQ